jgi:hypothetical protein
VLARLMKFVVVGGIHLSVFNMMCHNEMNSTKKSNLEVTVRAVFNVTLQSLHCKLSRKSRTVLPFHI